MSTVATRCELPNGSTCDTSAVSATGSLLRRPDSTHVQRLLLKEVRVVAVALALLIAQHLQALLVLHRNHGPGGDAPLDGCDGGRLSGAEEHTAAAARALGSHGLERDGVNDHGVVEARLRKAAYLCALLRRQKAAPQEGAVAARQPTSQTKQRQAASSRRVPWAPGDGLDCFALLHLAKPAREPLLRISRRSGDHCSQRKQQQRRAEHRTRHSQLTHTLRKRTCTTSVDVKHVMRAGQRRSLAWLSRRGSPARFPRWPTCPRSSLRVARLPIAPRARA